MFKYVLYRALQTTANVFCNLDPPPLKQCQEIMDKYNRRAESVWKCEEELSERQLDCEMIRQEVFSGFYDPPHYSEFRPVPRSIVKVLDKTFRNHYKSQETYLLFGRTDDKALEVQDKYALSIARALGKIDWGCEARAHLYLRKLYGKGAPLPLLTVASASAMWRMCNSHYYRQQIATVSPTVTAFRNLTNPFIQLHTWFEPFPEIMDQRGYGFVHSLYWFLRPKEGEEADVFLVVWFCFSPGFNPASLTLIQFYRSLMEWATDLHLVSLLQKYLIPPPRVTDLVHTQLMTVDQKDDIIVALRQVMKLWRMVDTPFDALLNHTCLDWNNEKLVEQVFPSLPSAMFDLMLGDKIRRLLLDQYSDVHSIRDCIETFMRIWSDDLEPRSQPAEIWWDGVRANAVPHKRWVSRSLGEDQDFETLVDSWAHDNKYLQVWLRGFEKTTNLANNWGKGGEQVFSEETAIEVMKFAKVRSPGTPTRKRLTPISGPRKIAR
jgi:hypothetical protein